MKTGVLAVATAGALLCAGGAAGSHEQFTPPPGAELHNPYLSPDTKHDLVEAEATIAQWATKFVIALGSRQQRLDRFTEGATSGEC
jgi:hypothetical protein